jgi:hypothetical protein
MEKEENRMGETMSAERGRELHDRSTRGGVLSPEEQSELESWYREQDREEATLLGSSGVGPSLASLQTQVDEAVAHLSAVTERIQELVAQNDALRDEIATLHRQLTQRSVVPAS